MLCCNLCSNWNFQDQCSVEDCVNKIKTKTTKLWYENKNIIGMFCVQNIKYTKHMVFPLCLSCFICHTVPQFSTHTGMLENIGILDWNMFQLNKFCFVPVYFCIWTRYGRHNFNRFFSVWYKEFATENFYSLERL